jgi:mRNA-degrading endonuclease RelE of RelBE toxin-antitoxin system
MIVPMARKSVIAGINHHEPPAVDHLDPGRLFSLRSDGIVSVAEHLAELRPFDRKRVLDQIDEQLAHQPTWETRNKKKLIGLVSPWEHVAPVWELRVGEFRVFYDVDEEESLVTVRAVRHKLPHKMTEEIL